MNTININIPMYSYGFGGLLYLLLAVLLVFAWRGRGIFILLAVSFNALWAFALAYAAYLERISFLLSYWLDIVRYALWLFFVAHLITGGLTPRKLFGGWPLLSVLALGSAVLVGLMIDASSSYELSQWPLISLLVLSILGVVLIEQFYRNVPLDKRWAVKFLCLSIGGLFAYDVYLYAHSLLFRQVDLMIWAARGAANGLIVPLVAIAISRNPQWDLRIFVSRHVIFYSASIVVAGLYLLGMALGGYYIREYGGSWGEFLELVLVFAAGLFLLVVLMSAQLRSRLKHFLGEHFFSNKYDYRREWLRLIDAVAGPDQTLTLQQRTIKAVAQIVQARGGVMWFRYGRQHYMPVAAWNHDMPDTDRLDAGHSMVKYLIEQQKVVDFTNRDQKKSLPCISSEAWMSSMDNVWLIIPLFHENTLLGFIVLARADYSPGFTWEDEDLLKTVGQQLSSYLLQQEAATKLAESQQFDAFNQLTTFIIHDLKNLISQLDLLVQNAAQHKNNPAFIEDAIETIDNAVGYMGRLIEQLKSGETAKNKNTANVGELLEEVIQQCSSKKPVPQLQASEETLTLMIDQDRLAMMVKHLIDNAQDATDDNGFVRISYEQENSCAVIKVEDNGIGMDKRFIDHRLFRPFDSTKGAKGMGIGVYEVKEFVRNSGGEIFVKSIPGEGTLFTLLLPVHT